MTRWTLLGTATAAALLALASAHPAAAASAVTFVSRTGRDAGACTRAAPCQTFHYAIAQTAAGGVLTALDRSGYGSVMITQSITILGPGRGGAAMSPMSGNTGIIINAPGATVVLRGLEIDGGFDGIDVNDVGSLDIGEVVINGATNLGLNLNATGAKTTLHDSTIASVASDGIDVNAGSLVATRVSLVNNAGNGFFIQGASSTLNVIDSTVTGSTVGVDTRGGTTFVKGTVISGSSVRGVNNDGGTIYLDTTTAFGSGSADVNQGTGTAIYTYGNNNYITTNGPITPIAGD